MNNSQPSAPAIALPPPVYFGLPGKFTHYRQFQDTAILRGHLSPARFVAQSAPVGFGKSLNAILQTILRGERAVVLTATKGLQDQYYREFHQMGMVDQRGRDNYPFVEDHTGKLTCESGPCMGGIFCKYKQRGCPYDAAVAAFNASQLAVTNYAWWLAVAGNPNIKSPAMLVLDEAHDAPAQLENALAFDLTDTDIRKYLSQPPEDQHPEDTFVNAPWSTWARVEATRLGGLVDAMAQNGTARTQPSQFRAIKRLAQGLGKLATASPSTLWVWERLDYDHAWRFAPLHPAQFAEGALFRGVPRVLLTSGTITPKTLTQLGLEPRNTDYQDYPSPFDPRRAPVVLLPTGIRNTRDISDEELGSLITTIDNIIAGRLDRKGIIHSVSYARQEWVLRNSRYAPIMFANRRKRRGGGNGVGHALDVESAAAVVQRFKQAPPPAVLVSPSVTTGWDFPGPECEYQIIPKLPFPDMSSRIMRARTKVDPEAATHACAVELQQMCGRGMRGERDRCETLILDASGRWFFGRPNAHHFNLSFWQFFQWGREAQLPAPPPKL